MPSLIAPTYPVSWAASKIGREKIRSEASLVRLYQYLLESNEDPIDIPIALE